MYSHLTLKELLSRTYLTNNLLSWAWSRDIDDYEYADAIYRQLYLLSTCYSKQDDCRVYPLFKNVDSFHGIYLCKTHTRIVNELLLDIR